MAGGLRNSCRRNRWAAWSSPRWAGGRLRPSRPCGSSRACGLPACGSSSLRRRRGRSPGLAVRGSSGLSRAVAWRRLRAVAGSLRASGRRAYGSSRAYGSASAASAGLLAAGLRAAGFRVDAGFRVAVGFATGPAVVTAGRRRLGRRALPACRALRARRALGRSRLGPRSGSRRRRGLDGVDCLGRSGRDPGCRATHSAPDRAGRGSGSGRRHAGESRSERCDLRRCLGRLVAALADLLSALGPLRGRQLTEALSLGLARAGQPLLELVQLLGSTLGERCHRAPGIDDHTRHGADDHPSSALA